MTKKEYLLNKIMEEAAEVIVIAAKYKSFGPDSFSPFDETKTTNKTNLGRELVDLMAVVQMAGQAGLMHDLTPSEWERQSNEKIEKVEKYMQSSRDCGILEKEEAAAATTD